MSVLGAMQLMQRSFMCILRAR